MCWIFLKKDQRENGGYGRCRPWLCGAAFESHFTNHSYYDYSFILKHANLIVDTRNVFSGLPDPDKKVFMA